MAKISKAAEKEIFESRDIPAPEKIWDILHIFHWNSGDFSDAVTNLSIAASNMRWNGMKTAERVINNIQNLLELEKENKISRKELIEKTNKLILFTPEERLITKKTLDILNRKNNIQN